MTDRDLREAIPMGERDSAPPRDAAHYREMAEGLRNLARQCRFPSARRELLNLAASYERRAEHFEWRARQPSESVGQRELHSDSSTP